VAARAGDRARRSGDEKRAREAYEAALAADRDNLRAHLGVQVLEREAGRELSLRRRYRRERPRGFLRGWLETGRRREVAFAAAEEPLRSLGAGFVARAAGDRVEAERAFRRAKRRDPGLSLCRNAVARWRLGRGQTATAGAEALAAAWSDPGHPLPWLVQSWAADRRGHLARAAEAAWEAAVRAPADERVTARLYALALRRGDRGFRERAAGLLASEPARRSAATLYRAAELWRRLGRRDEAAAVLEAAREAGWTEAEGPRPPALRGRPEPVRRFARAFARAVRARYRHYRATEEAETLEEFVSWARGLYERTTGEELAPRGSVQEFRFVGALVDAREVSDEPLVRALAAHDLLLVLGQRLGGPPEAILAPVERRESGALEIRGARIEREVVWMRTPLVEGYAEWGGGGDLAGLALAGLILVDLDAVAGWEGRLRRRRAELSGNAAELLAAEALADRPVRAVDDPAGVADRLNLTGPLDLAAEVRVHEDAHLVDAALHLPVGRHTLRNLKLVLSRGLSSQRVLAYLERNAQLTAIASGPTPRSALATCCARLGGSGPHATGYTEIVQGLVDAILEAPERYPAIDPERVVVQQLHRLQDEEIRALARGLLRRWGLLVESR